MAKYLYNGIELPELPERDTVTYPYAYIYTRNDSTFLEFTDKVRSPYSDGTFGLFDTGIIYKLVDGAWADSSVGNTGFVMIWTNTDIFYDDGTLYLAATEPVPVKTEDTETEDTVPTLTARDLYRKVNGKNVKLTLYKKLNGELIPLDEHTKEVKT